MSNQYEQLKEYTICVADTGEVEAIKKFLPQDATTNPSLIYKAASLSEYESLIDDAVTYGKGDLAVVMVRGLRHSFCRNDGGKYSAAPLRIMRSPVDYG